MRNTHTRVKSVCNHYYSGASRPPAIPRTPATPVKRRLRKKTHTEAAANNHTENTIQMLQGYVNPEEATNQWMPVNLLEGTGGRASSNLAFVFGKGVEHILVHVQVGSLPLVFP